MWFGSYAITTLSILILPKKKRVFGNSLVNNDYTTPFQMMFSLSLPVVIIVFLRLISQSRGDQITQNNLLSIDAAINFQEQFYNLIAQFENLLWYTSPLIQIFIIVVFSLAIASVLFEKFVTNKLNDVTFFVLLVISGLSWIMYFVLSQDFEVSSASFQVMKQWQIFGMPDGLLSLSISTFMIFLVAYWVSINNYIKLALGVVIEYMILVSVVIWLSLGM
jgi:hypothetical protein